MAEHVAVILDRRAAARRGDEDGVEPLALDLVASRRRCWRARAGAPAPRGPCDGRCAPQQPSPFGEHDLDAEAAEQPDRGDVDARVEHRLRAAGEERHAAAPLALRREAHARPYRLFAGSRSGASCSIASQPRADERRALASSGASGRAEPRQPQRDAEAAAIGQHAREQRRAAAGRRTAAGRSSRSAPAPGRRDACSRRPTGRWSRRRGRRGSGRCGARPPSTPACRSPACP